MYNVFLDWVITNFTILSIVIAVVIAGIVVLFRWKAKLWNWKEIGWGLNELVPILLSAYTIPTGLLIILCCTHIEKLNALSNMGIYLIVAGGSLIYTSISSFVTRINKD